jgi:hypothetical protein
MVAFMFAVFVPMMMSIEGMNSEFPAIFFSGFIIFWFLIMFSSLLQMAASVFYLIHIIKNKNGMDILRILSAIGAFYMPYIALPFYYFVYIWPDKTPGWALEKSAAMTEPNAA